MSTIDLQPTETLTEAGRKVFAYHFRDFLKQEAGVRSGEDIEAVHDMRVATRRMRATIRIFGNGFAPRALKFLKNGLKETAQFLGSVRDFDVFIEKFTAYEQAISLEEQEELTQLVEYCYLQRNHARTKLLAYLDSDEYEKFKTKAADFITKEEQVTHSILSDKPIPYQMRHIAPALIYSRYEAIRAYEPFLNDAPVELLHQLRIDFKHFRYALENFQEILGDEITIVLSEVKQIQNHLGDLNDTNVARQFLENFLNDWKHYRKTLSTSPKKLTAVIRYLDVKIVEQELLLAKFPDFWNQFNSLQLRHHLASAIADL